MIKLSEIVLYLFIFFLVSTGIFFLIANIAVSNNQLDQQSQDDLENLNIYYDQAQNPFNDNQSLNYSLSDYSNTDDFAQSNIETKGALSSIMELFSSSQNKLSAITAPIKFAENMLPIPEQGISWTYAMLAAFVGIIIFIAFLAAWKAGIW